jgi:N-acetyl-anhydromuramyl-L-alanine amidase AmpD
MKVSSYGYSLPCAVLLTLSGCDGLLPLESEPVAAECVVPVGSVSIAELVHGPLDEIFGEAAVEFGVPVMLLKAIGWVETRWQMVRGHAEFPGQAAGYGIMALRGDHLALGARLSGSSVDSVRFSARANVRAAAAVLRYEADRLGLAREELRAWGPAVAEYSGIALAEGRSAYVHDDVFAVVRAGVEGDARASLQPQLVFPDFPVAHAPARTGAALWPVDHPAALWRGSPNFNARPAGEIGKVAVVIIHSCEGAYTGCWSWLANPDARVSTHYVVREDGREITQMVAEAQRAWHIGSRYDCALNSGADCWRNGHSNNHFTLGIELAGYASQPLWPAAQIDASARLVCDVTRRHDIPRDAIHILGHAQLQPHDRSDPGRNWPWEEFFRRLHTHCGSSPAELVVDASEGGNDPSRSRAELSSAWFATRATPGYYGNGYYFAPTGPTPDPALFRFYLPAPGTHTIDAWWTAAGNRSRAARFSARDPQGRILGSATVDQQKHGSRWNTLGTWAFPQGWNSVELSREGPRGCVVIADAVRLR